jgi:hypothetical protein
MMRFQQILYIGYFMTAMICYYYLRNAWFPQFPTKLEKFVSVILALVWIVSVPVTFIMKQGDDTISMETSYDGFLGREQ